jgi:putative ABC transport system permease protein
MREVKYALNVLFRNKLINSLIVIGLSIGITSALVVMMYVYNQMSYDKYIPNADSIYRVTGNNFTRDEKNARHPAIFFETLKSQIPAIDYGVCMMSGMGYMQSHQIYSEQKFWVVDPETIKMFNIHIVDGDRVHPLTDGQHVMLSTTKARELFGDENPIGQTIKFRNQGEVVISATFEPLPKQSHFQADILLSHATFRSQNSQFDRYNNWRTYMFYIYLKFKPNADLPTIEQTMGQLWKQHAKNMDTSYDACFKLQPVNEIYLHSKLAQISDDVFETGNYITVVSFAVIGVLILLISCFNFINLSIAQLSSQISASAKQKILGASNAVVVRHHFIQVAMVVLVATGISLLSVFLLMPHFSTFGIEGLTSLGLNTTTWIILAVIILGIFLLVALIPAWRLSKVKAVDAFRRDVSPVKISSSHRLMVIIQYIISAVLIVATIVINKQMTCIRQANVGFNRENILIIKNPWGDAMAQRYQRMRDELKKLPDVKYVSGGMNIPTGGIYNWGEPICKASGKPSIKHTGIVSVDYNYFKALGSKLLYGREFSPDFPSDETCGIVVNKTFCDQLGIANPVGMDVTYIWDNLNRHIIGVVDDIQHNTLHDACSPVIYLMKHNDMNNNNNLIIKLQSDNLTQTCKAIESMWYQTAPEMKYDAFFLDSQFNSQYKSEESTGKVMTLMTLIAIVLCSMGLLGVSLFYIQRKSREIGIRKVNGATSSAILMMICGKFIKWVGISLVFAVPFSWFIMNHWLKSFTIKTELNAWIFVGAGFIVMCIALVTVGGQSLWASLQNPVKTLRNN